MIIRLMNVDDEKQLREIHNKYYKDEFAFPFDGPNKLLDKYVIVDNDDKIITFGALECVLEGIVITNKLIDIRERREAFYKLLTCLKFSAKQHEFGAFHLSSQDPKWAKHLKKSFDFKDCKGTFLYTEV